MRIIITINSFLLSLALLTNGLTAEQRPETLLVRDSEHLNEVTQRRILIPDGYGGVKYIEFDEINAVEPAPFFHAPYDVRFLLYTRANSTVPQQLIFRDMANLKASNYDSRLPTRVIIHGFQGGAFSNVNTLLTAAFLRNSDVNVIVVDWSIGATTINYISARNRVFEVGPLLAQYLDFLHEQNSLNFGQLTVVGHSLGAHTAGLAGKAVTRGRINTIVGLDPAGPLFDLNNPRSRLDFSDAVYVESIHTDTTFGIGATISHADFFPNNGVTQPGCWTSICDHSRAVHLFAESINSDRLRANQCSSLGEIINRVRCVGESVVMGGEPSNAQNYLRGIYQVITNRQSPFGRG